MTRRNELRCMLTLAAVILFTGIFQTETSKWELVLSVIQMVCVGLLFGWCWGELRTEKRYDKETKEHIEDFDRFVRAVHNECIRRGYMADPNKDASRSEIDVAGTGETGETPFPSANHTRAGDDHEDKQ